jgi:hypothetical protein
MIWDAMRTGYVVEDVHSRIRKAMPSVMIASRRDDLGCNENWLRGVKLARTKWVHILHDDDLLLPAFSELLEMPRDKYESFYAWDGAKHGLTRDGSIQIIQGIPGGVYSTDVLWPRLLKRSAYSISPVAGLFTKDHLVSVLEECERNFTDQKHFIRHGMMVGNDLLIWMRAADEFIRFRYIKKQFVSYGHWDGSATVQDCKLKRSNLLPTYNAARDYYLQGPSFSISDSRPMVHLSTSFGIGTKTVDFALSAWSKEYRNGKWTRRLIHDKEMPRMFDDDRRKVPYLKDMIELGMKGQSEDAIFVFANSDIIPCEGITRLLAQAFETHASAYSYRRDTLELRRFSPEEIRTKAKMYCGLDLFAFTKQWWDRYSDELPDVLFATDVWDYCLQLLMAATGGKKFCYLIYHLEHEHAGVRYSGCRSMRYNIDQAEPFLVKYGGILYWKEDRLSDTWMLNPK